MLSSKRIVTLTIRTLKSTNASVWESLTIYRVLASHIRERFSHVAEVIFSSIPNSQPMAVVLSAGDLMVQLYAIAMEPISNFHYSGFIVFTQVPGEV